jgi:hypothetical protein
MDHADVERLRDRHPAWRLLRASNAPLVLAFLGRFFVEGNNGAAAASTLASALDDELYALNAPDPTTPRYPKPAAEYLEDWAHADAGWLRRFYPLGSDEVHYDATPAFEKAYAWVTGLGVRPFVGTESRLHTAVELLRQIVHGAETDPQARLAELHKRRDEIDHEIAEVEAGNLTVLGPTALRDRYQQFAARPGWCRRASAGLTAGLSDLTVRLDELAKLDLAVSRALVIENEITFLSVPIPRDGAVLWGKGFEVDRTGAMPWLTDAQVAYWGDLDTHGFAILNKLRAWLPQTRSVLMDRGTLLAHRDRWVVEPSPTAARLDRLTPDEQALYQDLVTDRLGERVRLEQERIAWDWVAERLPC